MSLQKILPAIFFLFLAGCSAKELTDVQPSGFRVEELTIQSYHKAYK